MPETSGAQILLAIQSGRLQLDVVPEQPTSDPADTDLYDIVIRVGNAEFAKIGVWKSAAGGVSGDGRPKVNIEKNCVQVSAGQRLSGSFVIQCESKTEAETLGKILWEKLDDAYEAIEVDAAVTGTSL